MPHMRSGQGPDKASMYVLFLGFCWPKRLEMGGSQSQFLRKLCLFYYYCLDRMKQGQPVPLATICIRPLVAKIFNLFDRIHFFSCYTKSVIIWTCVIRKTSYLSWSILAFKYYPTHALIHYVFYQSQYPKFAYWESYEFEFSRKIIC